MAENKAEDLSSVFQSILKTRKLFQCEIEYDYKAGILKTTLPKEEFKKLDEHLRTKKTESILALDQIYKEKEAKEKASSLFGSLEEQQTPNGKENQSKATQKQEDKKQKGEIDEGGRSNEGRNKPQRKEGLHGEKFSRKTLEEEKRKKMPQIGEIMIEKKIKVCPIPEEPKSFMKDFLKEQKKL